jgi:hypothetical protein
MPIMRHVNEKRRERRLAALDLAKKTQSSVFGALMDVPHDDVLAADHPAPIIRQVLPSQARVYGWTSTGGHHYVLWNLDGLWVKVFVFGSPWTGSGSYDDRFYTLASNSQGYHADTTLPDLVMTLVDAAGDTRIPDVHAIAGLMRLMPEGEQRSTRTLIALTRPDVTVDPDAVSAAQVWEETTEGRVTAGPVATGRHAA